MKKLVCLFAVLLLVSVAAYPFQLSFKVSRRAMIVLNGNDYNKVADSYMKSS